MYTKIFPVVLILVLGCLNCTPQPDGAAGTVDSLPAIDPDYIGATIPPNIASLNFTVEESGTAFLAEITGHAGGKLRLKSTGGEIKIPLRKWKKLLGANAGTKLEVEISVQNEKGRVRYRSFDINIAPEKIDPYLVYRLIEPQFTYWRHMGLYQRNLGNFSQKEVLHNRVSQGNCINCHSFCNNGPHTMLFHMRGGPGSGTTMIYNGKIFKVNTSTDFNRAGAYPAWHPNGEIVAFSVNKLTQFFHAVGENRDVIDWASDLILYNVAANTVTTHPLVSREDRLETFPAWSPDGRYLYFCSAPPIDSFRVVVDGIEDILLDRIRYSIKRIAYDAATGKWGGVETVIDAKNTRKSATMPRISPDGRFLLACLADYGNFPIYRPECDVYALDLGGGRLFRPASNSDRADTYHSWSSNSRWFVFSSKRRNGLTARPYFCYVDENGEFHKPFVLPQKDPAFYDTFFKTFNVPELVKGPIPVRGQVLARRAQHPGYTRQATLDPAVKPRVEPDIDLPMWKKGGDEWEEGTR